MRSYISFLLLLAISSPAFSQVAITGQVASDRPRIFVTPQTLDAWRARFNEIPELKTMYDDTRSDMWGRSPSDNAYVASNELLCFAIFYLAEDRSQEAFDRAIDWMEFFSQEERDNHWGHPLITKAMSVAYDWLYPDLSATQRQRYGEAIIRYADLTLSYADHDAPPPGATWANQVSDYFNQFYWHHGRVPFAGIALDGEPAFQSDADRYLGMAREWLWDHMLAPTNQAGKGGGWFESLGYNQMTCTPLADLLEAWRTATGQDLFPHSTWLPGNAAWVLHSLIPHNGEYVPLDDVREGAKPSTGQDAVGSFSPLLAARYNDRFAQYFVETLYPSQYPMWHVAYLLWYRDDLEPVDLTDTPLSRRFEGLGQVNVRSGWGPGDTFAIYRAGNVYGGHGHYSSGHFLIYRGGDLVVEDGDYGYKSADAHNTLYIGGEMRDLSRSTPQHYIPTMDGTTYDYGEITRHAHDRNYERYDWIDSDLTPAYTSAQASSVSRRFVYLRPSTFVVIDHVESPANVQKRFRVHARSTPQIDAASQSASWQQSAGRLFLQTLLPEDALLQSTREEVSTVISVAPPQTSESRTFVNVLYAAGVNDQAPASSLISSDNEFHGLRVDGADTTWAVLFRGKGVGQAVTYTVDGDGPVRHLIADLDGEAVRVEGPGAPEEPVEFDDEPATFETPTGGTFTLTVVDPDAVPPAPEGVFPDFDESGTVDFPDFLLFAAHFGTAEGQAAFDPVFDLEPDGRIDFSDFLLFAGAFGRTSTVAS